MICTECHQEKTGPLLDEKPISEVMRLCKEWRCAQCSRTDEQVQTDFDLENLKHPHQSAHDWEQLKKC